MKKIAFALILLIAFLLIFGCTNLTEKSLLVGSWGTTSQSLPDEFAIRHYVDVSIVFDANGTGSIYTGLGTDIFSYQVVDKNNIKIYYPNVEQPKWQTFNYQLLDDNTLVFFNYTLSRKS